MKHFLLILLLVICNLGFTQQLPQKITNENQIVYHKGYILSYNETYEQANWVKYTLTPNDLIGYNFDRTNNFKEDTLIKTGSATNRDYSGSGYDRGHLKPAGDAATDSIEMVETFFLSNVSPQDPSFNRGIWKKLENYVRVVALESDSVVVITGGVLTVGLKTIGPNKVAVPNHYYKVLFIYNNNMFETLCFILPNKKSTEELSVYLVDLKTLELFVGLEF
jgi:endonuclease G